MMCVIFSQTNRLIMHNTETTSTNPLSFSRLPLKDALLTNIESLGYKNMTAIQEKSLPMMLHGHDIIAKANTGSGKTAAFGLCVLNHIETKLFVVQALVLCPTRELAEQTSQAMRQLARQMPNIKIINLSGGIPMKPQLDSLKHGAHIIVGTPGRIQKHLDKESIQLDKLTQLVLDEADRMLDMGFSDAIQAILKFCPKQRQTLLFSATYPSEIKAISCEFMKNPIEIMLDHEPTKPDIKQICYEVTESNRFSVLIALLKEYPSPSTLIFCNTKQLTTDVANQLKQNGFSAIALNGDMEQIDRDLTIIQFTNQSCTILVATDVAARGLDIKDCSLVINYDLAYEPDTHTHRIGRTGRAGNKGMAINLTKPSDAHRICAIEDAQGSPIILEDLTQLTKSNATPIPPIMTTVCLDAGKKDKIRAGDILGALTKDLGLTKEMIGKIDILPMKSYVAIHTQQITRTLNYFQKGKLKGQKINARKITV